MRRKRRALTAAQIRVLRIAGWAVLAVLAVLPVLWVLFFAPTTGKFATSFGSAVHDPKDFLITRAERRHRGRRSTSWSRAASRSSSA